MKYLMGIVILLLLFCSSVNAEFTLTRLVQDPNSWYSKHFLTTGIAAITGDEIPLRPAVFCNLTFFDFDYLRIDVGAISTFLPDKCHPDIYPLIGVSHLFGEHISVGVYKCAFFDLYKRYDHQVDPWGVMIGYAW